MMSFMYSNGEKNSTFIILADTRCKCQLRVIYSTYVATVFKWQGFQIQIRWDPDFLAGSRFGGIQTFWLDLDSVGSRLFGWIQIRWDPDFLAGSRFGGIQTFFRSRFGEIQTFFKSRFGGIQTFFRSRFGGIQTFF